MKAENLSDITSYLSFRIGEEIFACNVIQVLSILDLLEITKVPLAPSYLKGIINVRGIPLPVIDTHLKIGMSETEFTDNSYIIIMEYKLAGEYINLGILVDDVIAVIEVKNNEIQSPPAIGDKNGSEIIYGMIKSDEKFMMLINIEKLFSSHEVIEIKEKMDHENSVVS